MAVFNPALPNLSNAYGNIQQALEQSAAIAGKNTGALGSVAAAAAPVAAEGQELNTADIQNGQVAFKGAIEDQLNKNKAYYDAEAQGKTLWTQDDIDKLMKTHYPNIDPKNYPDIGDTGIQATPADIQALGEHAEAKGSFEVAASQMDRVDKTKGEAMRIFQNDPTQLAQIMGVSALKKGTDAYGRDYYYSAANPLERIYAPTNNAVVTDPTQVTPQMRKPITEEQQGLTKSLAPIQTQMSNLDESEKLLNDPNAKGIEQNRLLLQTARAAAGNVRNWKEVAVVSGNPDIFNQATKAINSLIEGPPLTEEDKSSLKNLITSDRQRNSQDMATLTQQAVSRATVNAPLVDPGLVDKTIRAGAATGTPQKTNKKVPVQGPNGQTGVANPGQKLPTGWSYVNQ